MKLPEWTLDRVGEANQPKTEGALSEFLRFQCSQTKRSEVGQSRASQYLSLEAASLRSAASHGSARFFRADGNRARSTDRRGEPSFLPK